MEFFSIPYFIYQNLVDQVKGQNYGWDQKSYNQAELYFSVYFVDISLIMWEVEDDLEELKDHTHQDHCYIE